VRGIIIYVFPESNTGLANVSDRRKDAERCGNDLMTTEKIVHSVSPIRISREMYKVSDMGLRSSVL
jgi:hypothetical protein